jgi:methylaspartate mutase epsilon subunit
MEPIKIRNKRIDDNAAFMKKRRDALDVWPTGKEVDFEEAVEYQKSLPDSKVWWKVMAKLRDEGRMSVFPRAGVALVDDMIALCTSLAASGVVLIPVTTDSYTRKGAYEKIAQALEESKKTGKTILNGYPIINHGVKNTRRVIESCEAAFSPRGGDLAAMEVSIASGMTAAQGSLFLGFGSYAKKPTLEQSIESFLFRTRVIGWYADRGVILSGDLHGWVPSCTFPLSINIASHVIEALAAAEQGQKAFTPLVHYEGYIPQDLAWTRLSPRIIREYLDTYGYKDVILTGVSPQQIPLFPVPLDFGGAFAYLTYTAMVASLAKGQCVYIRTIDEGAGVPSTEAHQMSYRASKWIFDVIREQEIEIDMKEVAIEEEIAEKEVRAILDKVFEMGDGDVLVGAVKAVEAGVLDSPWSANIHIKDECLGVRDARGGCRYLEYGNIPIPQDVRQFHREKLAEREKREGKKLDYHTAVRDLWCFSKGKIVGLAPYDK